MTSRGPTTPDPSRMLALTENTWVKIKSCMAAMQRDGFKDGYVVLIRKVQESNTTPGRWTNVVNDTQYAIGHKVLVKFSTE
ncbi:hypothetical protein PILCRDRAFT_12952 [Piloderma croceum F 1598]|uniref:Uncharacterized protein n=1 Tax=Piloderma croceum (strain F 1598) TaxID=765440 RepID=A0A0C3F8L6_PILCF|nr:hypothetical protein PILCRDRAFT_12952 [Piloderma croceum F 1598]